MAVSGRRKRASKTRVFRSYEEYARYYDRPGGADKDDLKTVARTWAIETMEILTRGLRKASKKATACRRRGSR